jgi:enoyl-CoA hydratase/carnithine racemase
MHAPPAATSPPVLLREDLEGVALLRLNRPGARHALSQELIATLSEELAAIAADRHIRCVVLAASGGEVFCAGHDLKEMTGFRAHEDRGRAAFAEAFTHCSAMMQQIVNLPQPVITAVEGLATAAGAQLVASCDLAVAGASARFCTPGVHIGLFCSTPMVALSRNLSPKHAMEMLLLGEMVDADTALRFALVNRVVPAGAALESALQWAAAIAAKSPLTVAIGKRAFHDQRDMPQAEAYVQIGEVMTSNMLARDAEEGIDAFIEKRTPVWRGE